MESPIGYADLDPAQKACAVSKVHEATSRYFAHWEDSALREEELDGAIASLLESALRSQSRWDFTLLVTEFVARLNNPHTRFLDELLYSRPDIGFEVLRLEDKWVVVRSARSDITRGDRLVAIDGVSTAEWFERLTRYNAGRPTPERSVSTTFCGCFCPTELSRCWRITEVTSTPSASNGTRILLPRMLMALSTDGSSLARQRIFAYRHSGNQN